MKYFIPTLLLFFCFSCGGESNKKGDSDRSIINLDTLMEMNRNLIKKNKALIQEYVKNQDKEMTETGTGLFYSIVNDVEGAKAVSGDRALFEYSITSLSGELIYTSKKEGKKEFLVDESEIESGWNEAAKLMSKGDSLLAILPPHLAFRNIGDGNKIGPGQILIYNLRLDSLIN